MKLLRASAVEDVIVTIVRPPRRARELFDAISELPDAREWLPIETAPKMRKVLLGYPNKLGNWRTVIGRYYLPGTLECADDDESGDEDGYAQEGWYEESESQETIRVTDEPPTHWQPLPPPYDPTTTPQVRK